MWIKLQVCSLLHTFYNNYYCKGEVLGSADNTDDEGGCDGARSHSIQLKSLKNRSRNDTDVLVSACV